MFRDRNRLGVGLMTLFALGLGLPAAVAQVVILPTISGGWTAMAAAMDPDTDDIMAVGAEPSESDFVAASLTYKGAVNKAFGGGIVTDTLAGAKYEAWPYTCAVNSEGRLLSAGICGAKGGDCFTVVRYDTNGDLDKTFGKKGIVTTQFNGILQATLRAMTLQYSGTDEKIVVAGSNWESNPVMLARYTDTGVLDATFGAGGTVSTTTPFNWVLVLDAAVQSDGSIIVCALGETAAAEIQMVFIRYTADGVLDTSFGESGYATLMIDGADTWAKCIAVDDDDRIVVGGSYDDGGDADMALARFTADGDLDDTFGDGGVVTESFAGIASAIAIDGEGNIVACGSNGDNLVVARFTSDGDLDDTFGSSDGEFNGQGYADDFPYPVAVAHGVQIQSDDQIVAVGSGAYGVNAVVRYNPNGTPDKTF